MTEDEHKALYNRLVKMTKADQELLDLICEALSEHTRAKGKPDVWVLPNRIIALACVDLYEKWHQHELERS